MVAFRIFSCGARTFQCSSFLSNCGVQASGHMGSVVAECGLICPLASGILVPQPGTESTSPELEGGFLTPGPPEKSLKILSNNLFL